MLQGHAEPEDSEAFFLQLLHGLLANLQPLQQHEGQQPQDSPLQEACKEVLAAVCQLVGPQHYLHQVLHSVPGLTDQAAPVAPKALEVASVAPPLLCLPVFVNPEEESDRKDEVGPLLCCGRFSCQHPKASPVFLLFVSHLGQLSGV